MYFYCGLEKLMKHVNDRYLYYLAFIGGISLNNEFRLKNKDLRCNWIIS